MIPASFARIHGGFIVVHNAENERKSLTWNQIIGNYLNKNRQVCGEIMWDKFA